MKALIMSDSHGWEDEVKKVIERHKNDVDAVIHCGDSELSSSSNALEGVVTVKGNCDFGNDFPEEAVKKVKDTTFFAGHGHLLNVKMTEMNLIYKGKENNADIVCYGHTHVPAAVQEKGMVIINPGSMRLPRQYPAGTYVIVEVAGGQTHVNYHDLDGNILDDLSKTFNKNG